MTTKEAFLQLVSKKKWYADLPITEGAAWTLAKRVRDGELISLDKMEEVLGMAGYMVVQEKLWAHRELADQWNSELDKALKGEVFNAGGLSGHFYQVNINDIIAVTDIGTEGKLLGMNDAIKQVENAGTVSFKSDIKYLIDMPFDYFDTFEPWAATHCHMFPEGTEYMEKVRMYDEYMKRRKAAEEKIQTK